MSMSDCIKCWDTPCSCGYHYRNMSAETRIKQAAIILGVDAKALADKVNDILPALHPQNEVNIPALTIGSQWKANKPSRIPSLYWETGNKYSIIQVRPGRVLYESAHRYVKFRPVKKTPGLTQTFEVSEDTFRKHFELV